MRITLQRLFLLLIICAHPIYVHSQPQYEQLQVDGGTLLIDWRDEFSAEEKTKLRAWQTNTINTVMLLHGDLPRPEIRIAFQRYRGNNPVPFARVLRDQPEGILFYINPERPLAEFVNDWTAYHEFTHLFIPYPSDADIWFSEGLASYYQNILQFRAGLLTRDETIAKLEGGFTRARNDTKNADLTLAELSPQMRTTRSFMRVYWSGALYFLVADITLRQTPTAADRPRTLDAVLKAFNACCLLQPKEWTGAMLASEFDQLAGTTLFVPLYNQYEQSLSIPAFAPWLSSPEMDAILAIPNPPIKLAVK